MLIYVVFKGNMIVFISICICYQSSIVLAFYLFIIIILTQLGRIILKRLRAIIWMRRYSVYKKYICIIINMTALCHHHRLKAVFPNYSYLLQKTSKGYLFEIIFSH